MVRINRIFRRYLTFLGGGGLARLIPTVGGAQYVYDVQRGGASDNVKIRFSVTVRYCNTSVTIKFNGPVT